MIASLADQPGGEGLVAPASPASGAALPWATSLAIALGANLGDPRATLVAVRPLLQALLEGLLEERGQAGPALGSPPSGSGGSGCGGLARPAAAPLALDRPTPHPLSPAGPKPGPGPGPGPSPEPGSQRSAIRLRWSPLFCTEPVGGPPGQPAYLNGVLLVEGVAGLEPRPLELLQGLQALEAQFGRQRLEAWGPRTLDLDLLWWGDQVVQAPALQLPHPRLQQRSFVLAPLAAIDPLLVPPGPAAAGTPSPGSDCASLLAALLPRLREAAPQRLPGCAGWPE